jgi:O-antigen/teichoic acid export membrane protein
MGLVATIIVARLLGVAGFGELGLIRSTVLTLGVLTGYGIGLTTTKYVAELQYSDSGRAGRIISLTLLTTFSLSLAATVLMWVGASWIADYLNFEVSTAAELRLSGLLLVASATWSVLQAALMGFQSFRELALNNIIYGIITIILSILLTFTMGISGSILALSISAMVGAFLAGREVLNLCRERSIPLGIHFQSADLGILWKFGLPAYFSGIVVMPVTWWAYSRIAALQGGNVEMGLFNAADQWRTLILFVPQALSAVVLPMLTDAYAKHNVREYRRVLLINLLIVSVLGVFILMLIYSLRQLILGAYGRDFVNATGVLIILAVTGVVQSIGTIIGQSVYSLDKMRWAIIQNAAWAAAIVFGIKYVFDLSAMGLACSILMAYVVMTMISFAFVYVYVIRDKEGAMTVGFDRNKSSEVISEVGGDNL